MSLRTTPRWRGLIAPFAGVALSLCVACGGDPDTPSPPPTTPPPEATDRATTTPPPNPTAHGEAPAPTAPSRETRHFRGLVERHGVPTGVGPIKASKAFRMRHVVQRSDGTGAKTVQLVDPAGRQLQRWSLEDPSADLFTVTVHDASGRVEELQQVSNGGRLIDRRRPDGRRVDTRCDAYERTLDSDGHILKERCISATGSPREGGDGVHARRYEVNANGFRISELWTDAYGQKVAMSAPFEGTEAKKAVFSRRYQVDTWGQILEEAYFDADAQPTVDGQGVHRYARSVDTVGNITHEVAYGLDRQPIGNLEGVNQQRWVFENGHLREHGLLDAQGHPTVGPDGYSGIRVETSARGLPVKETYVVVEGSTAMPAANAKTGAFGRIHRWDTLNRRTESVFIDGQGQPMVAPIPGYATERLEYDDGGRVTVESTFDTQGRPIAARGKGYAVVKRVWDPDGRPAETRFENGRGEPTPGPEGWAIMTWAYERKEGQELWVTTQTLDASRAPTRRRGLPYAKTVERYDTHGRLLEHTRYDHQGAPAVDPLSRIHRERYVYDAHGDQIGARFFGPDDRPTIHRELGAAGIKRTFNDHGRELTLSLHDGGDLAIRGAEGWSKRERTYDSTGLGIEWAWFDHRGAPVVHPSTGAARTRKFYGMGATAREIGYFDASGEGVFAIAAGCAKEIRDVDSQGRIVGIHYVDQARKPHIRPELGYSHTLRTYDGRGRLTSERFFDNMNQLTYSVPRGYASIEYYYDGDGRVQREVLRDKDGDRVISRMGYAERQIRYHGSSRRVHAESFLGPGGKAVFHRDGYGEIRRGYDAMGHLVRVVMTDTLGNPTLDRDGAAERLWTWDGDRLLTLRTLGLKGTLTAGRYGTAGFDRAYDIFGRVVSETSVGANGTPMTDRRSGCAATRTSWSDHGEKVATSCLGPDMVATNGWEGWSTRTERWDGRGRSVRTRYANADGQAVLGPEGWAEELRVYDDRDDQTGVAWLGPDGAPLLIKEGYAGIQRSYDARGHLRMERYLGLDGQPVARDDGFSSRRFDRDHLGRELEVAHLDMQDGPAAGPGFSLRRQVWSSAGQPTSVAYLDGAGQPTSGPGSWATMRVTYSPAGQPIHRSYFDAGGKPGHPKGGFASERMAYDRFGRVRTVVTLDAQGDRVNRRGPQGRRWAHNRREYDRFGRTVEEVWFEASDRPASGPEGSHRIISRWDARGQLRTRVRFGEDGSPLPRGWAQQTYTYDRHGRTVRVEYEDHQGQPKSVWNGVGEVRMGHSDAGALVRMSYHGVGGGPIDAKVCYPGLYCAQTPFHEVRYGYDRGERVEMRLFTMAGVQVDTIDCLKESCF